MDDAQVFGTEECRALLLQKRNEKETREQTVKFEIGDNRIY